MLKLYLNCLGLLWKPANVIFAAREKLEDYPNSPGAMPHISGEDASQLLDTDDTMESAVPAAGCSTIPSGPSTYTGMQKHPLSEISHSAEPQDS
jgi:hypothetical protein